ncbi:transferase family-domain-containing protein [Nemania sp. FL0031]|nr:transferase family-domain-containing protein [Nemania sp. FL0031]
MATSSASWWLSPLDLLMLRTYITAVFTFRTTQTDPSIPQSLQNGLDNLAKITRPVSVPWLSGRVCPTTANKEQGRGLEIQYSLNDPSPTLMDKGTVEASYETLSALGLPPDAIPTAVWPVPQMIDEELFEKGAPIFGASLFRFAGGKGVGLCVSIHHNAVDATGFAEIVRLWAQYTAGLAPLQTVQSSSRPARLTSALESDLQAVSPQTVDDLFKLHPEYSRMSPAFPTEFPPCSCKIFTLSIAQINAHKGRLQEHLPDSLSTNTLVCALVWSAITRARAQRRPDFAQESSQLAMAVNGRRRLGAEFSSPEDPYLGNIIILVERMEDYRTVFVGWDLFGSRDLTITSWADLDLYDTTFGEGLGRPDFIRIPCSPADGVGIVLPRKKGAATGEVVEVMVMLRTDDMTILENDAVWNNFSA